MISAPFIADVQSQNENISRNAVKGDFTVSLDNSIERIHAARTWNKIDHGSSYAVDIYPCFFFQHLKRILAVQRLRNYEAGSPWQSELE